jgi:hypothetical protein
LTQTWKDFWSILIFFPSLSYSIYGDVVCHVIDPYSSKLKSEIFFDDFETEIKVQTTWAITFKFQFLISWTSEVSDCVPHLTLHNLKQQMIHRPDNYLNSAFACSRLIRSLLSQWVPVGDPTLNSSLPEWLGQYSSSSYFCWVTVLIRIRLLWSFGSSWPFQIWIRGQTEDSEELTASGPSKRHFKMFTTIRDGCWIKSQKNVKNEMHSNLNENILIELMSICFCQSGFIVTGQEKKSG